MLTTSVLINDFQVSQFLLFVFFWKKASEDKWYGLYLHARCPFCHPTNNVKELKETYQNTDASQWLGLVRIILASSNSVHPR